MSKYGLNFYGPGTFYGNPNDISFNASPFLAESKDYGIVELSWFKPVDDSLDVLTSLSKVRLVRNPLGYPEGPFDGTILFGSDESPLLLRNSGTSFLDYAPAGRYYYYSLFVTDQAGNWFLAGSVDGLSVKNFGSTQYLYDTLPTPFKASNLFNWKSGAENTQLYRYLSIIGFQMDAYRTDMSLLLRPYDMDRVKANIVPVILHQFGYDYEPSTSTSFDRRMAQNATFINKMRGTTQGISRYVESFTGWGVRLVPGKNLLLDRNDASAEESIGRWHADNICELYRRPSDATVPAYLEPGSPSNFPNGTAAVMQVLVNTSRPALEGTWGGLDNYTWGDAGVTWGGRPVSPSTAASFSLPNLKNIKLEGIPVKPSYTYTASARITRLETDRPVQLTMTWFNEMGLAIGWDSPIGDTITSGWATRITHTAIAPTGATWLGLTITIDSVVNGESFFVDTVQVEQSDTLSYYEDPRTTNIQLLPTRENLIKTPLFDSLIGSWVNTTASTPVTDIGVSSEVGTVLNDTFTNSLRFSEATAGVQTGVITASYSTYVRSNTALTFSSYVKSLGASYMTLGVVFSDQSVVTYNGHIPQKILPVTLKQLTSNVATLTSAAHGYAVGDTVYITNVDATFNTPSLQSSTITAVTTNTFSYAVTAANVASSACAGKVSKWGRHSISAVSPKAPSLVSGSINSGIITLTTSVNHGFSVGDTVTVSGALSSMNGTFVVDSVVSPTVFTYLKPWTDVALVSLPNGSVDGLRKVTVSVTLNGSPGVVGYLDAAMLEPLGDRFVTIPAYTAELAPGPFLSGRSNFGSASDVIWTGTALTSTSAWYPNRVTKFYRLRTTLNDHVPSGASFRLSFASRYGA